MRIQILILGFKGLSSVSSRGCLDAPAILPTRRSFRNKKIQPNPVDTETEGPIESVRIERVEFRENVQAFPKDKTEKLSVITRCSY